MPLPHLIPRTPFFEPFKINKFALDEERYMRIDVIFCTESDGKITPLRFRYQEVDERVTLNVDAVRSRKQVPNGISFDCFVTANGIRKLVTLICYPSELIWVMPKI